MFELEDKKFNILNFIFFKYLETKKSYETTCNGIPNECDDSLGLKCLTLNSTKICV